MSVEESKKSLENALNAAKPALEQPSLVDAPLHKAPSMLWFVIPMALLVVYALLTR